MNIFLKTTLAFAAFAALGTALPASAHTGTFSAHTGTFSAHTGTFSVFGTGVDAGGAVLPGGPNGDPHYTLIQNPVGTSGQIQVLDPNYGFPLVPNGWLPDSDTSEWIGPDNHPFAAVAGVAGLYDYRTTFDLTGFDPATASVSGRWASDNYGVDVLINGVTTNGGSPFNTSSSNNSYSPFSITSGFRSGVNTLDFLVEDDGQGTTGLRVDGITGSAAGLRGGGLSGSANPVPEASTTVSFGLLLALGLGGAVLARRKRACA